MGEGASPGRAGCLLVESDGPLRDMLCGALEEEGYQVGGSVQLLAAHQIATMNLDCLLLDGGREGPEAAVPFLRALRATAETADLPVVLIVDETPLASGAWEAMLDGVLMKPFDIVALFAVVEAALAGPTRW